jgi:hypothetical protein
MFSYFAKINNKMIRLYCNEDDDDNDNDNDNGECDDEYLLASEYNPSEEIIVHKDIPPLFSYS